ncbi:Glycoside hydrolase [Phytophthora palmivora]|uniref:Glycoside hydrolase n=1 Tax=Phytophthora palmivora TaxID=4796 RepID=A0A2P4XK47_9STRA|nr:Glycoside hydrolase [Phytophthora palmivora]
MMLNNILSSRLIATAVSCMTLVLTSSIGLANAEDLCSIVPYSYTGAKSDHPELTTAIETMGNYAIASWFTDRQSTQERSDMLSGLLSQCSEDSRLSIVVYGIPNKDCAAGFSSGGSVTSTDDYKAFLKELTDAVGDRKVLYVVEPDALGLLTQDGGCGASAGYLENLKVAVAALSANTNAELYVDIGYWMLAYSDSASKVATAMQDIGTCGRVKGVTINTSNYRSNDECTTYCTNFQTAMGSTSMTCVVDTSRNYNGSPTSDWCNVATAGIGKPPSSETGISNIDYFMWIKPPGESDGECSGGPAAGSFYLDGFTKLWDQGYFVSEQGMPKIGDSSTPNSDDSNPGQSDQTTSAPTPAPTTGSSSWSQEDILATVAPVDTTLTEASTITPSATTITPSTTTPAAAGTRDRNSCSINNDTSYNVTSLY